MQTKVTRSVSPEDMRNEARRLMPVPAMEATRASPLQGWPHRHSGPRELGAGAEAAKQQTHSRRCLHREEESECIHPSWCDGQLSSWPRESRGPISYEEASLSREDAARSSTYADQTGLERG